MPDTTEEKLTTKWMLVEDVGRWGFFLTAKKKTENFIKANKTDDPWEEVVINALGNFKVQKNLTVEIHIDPITLNGFKFTTKGSHKRKWSHGQIGAPMSIKHGKGSFSVPKIKNGGEYLVVKYLGDNPSATDPIKKFQYDMTIIGVGANGELRKVHIDPVITNDGCIGCSN